MHDRDQRSLQAAIPCLILVLAALLLVPPAAAQERPGRMYTLIEQYDADRGSLGRTYVLENEEWFTRMENFYQDWLQRLEEVDYAALNVAEGIDYTLLRRNVESDRAALRAEAEAWRRASFAVPFEPMIARLERQRRVGEDPDGQRMARRLDSLAAAVTEARARVASMAPLSPERSEAAADAVENLRETLAYSWEFYHGYDPDVTWWAEKPYRRADSLLGGYRAFLQGYRADQSHRDDGSGIIGNPAGREAVMEMLAYEMIGYTPKELIDLANREFAWCQREMLKASRELGYGDDWRAALEHVKQSYVPAGKQPEMIYGLATGAVDFLEEHDLLTIPDLAKETWRMSMMSPERQRYAPFFLGGEVIQISYPTNTMEHELKMMSMRGNNPHFSRATVHHELIAGHHLQGFMNDRHRPYREQAFSTPFWTEGWALYWELRLWDMGFPRSPEDRIGMLFWRMHRSARIIFSLSYHLGEMSPQESIDFLVEKVGHERANAEAEVRRSFTGGYGPLYQIAYLVGGLQFRALHHEFVVNGDMSEKEFHDFILRQNALPVDMVRRAAGTQTGSRLLPSDWAFSVLPRT
ncbi:MAG: DUF885 family protein [Balneolaceae bacterium]|nr:DUF885 family protein [Balneolaceae bacterium]